jgi:hypothetical protein
MSDDDKSEIESEDSPKNWWYWKYSCSSFIGELDYE